MRRTIRGIRWVVLAAALVAVSHTVSWAQEPVVCADALNAAQEAFNMARFQEAVDAASLCLQQGTPTDEEQQQALLLQGRSVFFMGRRDDAAEMLRSLFTTYPDVVLNPEAEVPLFLTLVNEVRGEVNRLRAIAAATASTSNAAGPATTNGLEATDPINTELVLDATEVDEIPLPVGGRADVQRNLVYPENADQLCKQGYVHVRFVVDTEGIVRDAEVWRGIGKACDDAVRDALLLTRYRPGKHNGEIVSVKMSMSFPFFGEN